MCPRFDWGRHSSRYTQIDQETRKQRRIEYRWRIGLHLGWREVGSVLSRASNASLLGQFRRGQTQRSLRRTKRVRAVHFTGMLSYRVGVSVNEHRDIAALSRSLRPRRATHFVYPCSVQWSREVCGLPNFRGQIFEGSI